MTARVEQIFWQMPFQSKTTRLLLVSENKKTILTTKFSPPDNINYMFGISNTYMTTYLYVEGNQMIIQDQNL